ncbi:MAG TPA: sulfatase-like hydrolase/transferase [Pirellulaceae bacterium]|nr:sulfatase-like hydrolase/transferase [Pirellulaceae bacterium]HMO91405.1 sulfatase-like hydrolase/transferase [Pirellulaceae bacterium]HMP69630.1 sulfatase-like hydrolase/transferase [Pirellulaceae bacterium]
MTCIRSIIRFLVLASLLPMDLGITQQTRLQEGKPNRPNILLLFADDQRCDTIHALGNPLIKTPSIDRLVNQGFHFTNAYCFGSPHGAVCIPSRAMLHAGKSLFRLSDVNLNLQGDRTLGQILGEHGYETFATGKWHNGRDSFAASFSLGRNIMFGGMSNHAEVPVQQMDPHDKSFSESVTGSHFSSKLFADAAIEFLNERTRRSDGNAGGPSETPFFCYVAFTAPHDPRMSPGNFNRLYRPHEMRVPPNFLPQHPFDNGDLMVRDEALMEWPRRPELVQAQLADYYGLISHLDAQVGRILDALQASGEAERTIIIYMADHGLALGSHGLLGKQNLYDHSMKAPLIIAGPGVQHGSSDALIYLHDLFATLLEFASISVPADVDSRSLVPILRGDSTDARAQLFTCYGESMRAVRDQRWKLIRYPRINRTQLFDLEKDPDEMFDLGASEHELHRTKVAHLYSLLERLQQESGDTHPLSVAEPQSGEIDLTGRERKPDPWQPAWIVEKYFGRDSVDNLQKK